MKTLQSHHLKERRKKKKKLMIFSFIFSFLIILGGLIYFLLFSEIFKIKDIKISEIKMADLTAIQQGLKNILNQGSVLGFLVVSDNILFMPSERINNFLKDFPVIESFSWERSIFSRSLRIVIKEREVAGILKKDDSLSYYFDKKGIIFAEAPSSEGGMLLIIENELGKDFNLGNCILDVNSFTELMNIAKFFEDNFQLDKIKLQVEKIEIIATLDNNHQTTFYLETDNLNQIYSVLTYFIQNNFDFNLEYLDLRYLPNVYYK